MANLFAFRQFGMGVQFTVTAAGSTFSFAVPNIGGGTMTLAAGNWIPETIRVVNMTNTPVFLQWGNSTVSVGLANAVVMLGLTKDVFRVAGSPFMATVCGSTATLNVAFGEGGIS